MIEAKPKASICSITFLTGLGAKAYSILDPSNGGMGIMLMTKMAMLMPIKMAI
jgi:hypothetical protein